MSDERAAAIVLAGCLGFLSAATLACSTRPDRDIPPVLLFTGTGTSPTDVAAVESILDSSAVRYATASSTELNAMGKERIMKHRLLIVPGGNFVEIGDSLTQSTTTHIRQAVEGGLNYLGICAGAFLAGSFPQPYRSVNLTSGVQFGFYAAARDAHKAVVPITIAGGPTLDQYWEDGPQLTGWGAVVARYPDGTPAVVQGTFGSGSVLLTGVHPEASERWRRGMTFRTPTSTDNAFAALLIEAALNRRALAHF